MPNPQAAVVGVEGNLSSALTGGAVSGGGSRRDIICPQLRSLMGVRLVAGGLNAVC
jgi:hypothetical protein